MSTNTNEGDWKLQDVVVTQTRMTVVKAESATVCERREPLTNLDFLIPKADVYVIFCYGKPKDCFDSMVATLKKTLADTLVEFYVFGGELVCNDSTGELEILCNNRGVDFVEASVDSKLSELDLHQPDELIQGKLAPNKKGGNLVVQVTEFQRCGSIVVTCKFNHRVADAYAANMFLMSWSENVLSKHLTYSPSRGLISPRSPPCHGREVESFYSPISSLPSPFTSVNNDSKTSRFYYVTADQTMKLQAAASTETSKRTKLESFSAFLWKLLAQSASQDIETTEDQVTKIGIIIDGRTRLTTIHDSDSLTNYFGNVISAPYVSEAPEVVNSKPLSWVGQRISEVIKAAANKDHFLDLIDLVETTRPETVVPGLFWPRSTDGPKVLVSSGLRFPMTKIDLGWGSPLLGFYYLPLDVDCGYVMPVSIPAGNGDWVVYMYLPTHQVDFIEKEASHFFKPFTFDLLPC